MKRESTYITRDDSRELILFNEISYYFYIYSLLVCYLPFTKIIVHLYRTLCINYLPLFSNLNSSPIKSNRKTTSNFCFISIRRSLELDVVLNIYIHSYLVEISGDLEWKIGIQIPTMNLNGN